MKGIGICIGIRNRGQTMIPVNVADIIEGSIIESNRIEFKRDWNPERILHTICAFANNIDNLGGGYIVVGVGEIDGRPWTSSA